MVRRWRSPNGIRKSRHSRRIVPMSLSQNEFAVGARGGDFRTRMPKLFSIRSKSKLRSGRAVVTGSSARPESDSSCSIGCSRRVPSFARCWTPLRWTRGSEAALEHDRPVRRSRTSAVTAAPEIHRARGSGCRGTRGPPDSPDAETVLVTLSTRPSSPECIRDSSCLPVAPRLLYEGRC